MNLTIKYLSLAITSTLLVACGSSGGGSAANGSTGGTATPAVATISGTVPGTKIEAFGDNGSYYTTNSTVPSPDNGKHPFSLEVPAGVGVHLVMTMDQGTADPADDVIQPIGFKDNVGNTQTRLVAGAGDTVDLGNVPLIANRADSAPLDSDGDGVLDEPFILDDHGAEGAKNPLNSTDANGNGVKDFDDSDNGGHQLDIANGDKDSQDPNDDGIPNKYETASNKAALLAAGVADRDGDGVPDSIDVNPDNQENQNVDLPNSTNGYLDSDTNHDGFPDQDSNHDGHNDSTGTDDSTNSTDTNSDDSVNNG